MWKNVQMSEPHIFHQPSRRRTTYTFWIRKRGEDRFCSRAWNKVFFGWTEFRKLSLIQEGLLVTVIDSGYHRLLYWTWIVSEITNGMIQGTISSDSENTFNITKKRSNRISTTRGLISRNDSLYEVFVGRETKAQRILIYADVYNWPRLKHGCNNKVPTLTKV